MSPTRGGLAVLRLLLAATGAHAQQSVGVPWRPGTSLHASVGVDPVPLLGAGVSHATPLPLLGLTALDAGADLPVMLLPSLTSWRLGVGTRSLLWSRWRLGVAHQATLRLERVRNSAVSALSPTAELRLQLGHFSRDWFLAAELGYRQVLATHLHFAPFVAQNFEGEPVGPPREGWYRLPAGYPLLGAVVGKELARGYFLALRVNVKRTVGGRNPWEDISEINALVLGLSLQLPLGTLPKDPR